MEKTIIEARPDYILTTMQGTIFPISNAARLEIITAARDGNKVFVFADTGECIQLSPMPEIILFERALQKDKDKLIRFKQFRCVYGQIHGHVESCRCKANNTPDSSFAVLAQKHTEKMIAGVRKIAKKMGIRPLSYNEQLKARADGGEVRAANLLKKAKKDV